MVSRLLTVVTSLLIRSLVTVQLVLTVKVLLPLCNVCLSVRPCVMRLVMSWVLVLSALVTGIGDLLTGVLMLCGIS